VEVHRSARRHGVADQDIRHAIEHPVVVADIDPDADPPKLLAIGPDLETFLRWSSSRWPATGCW
jgi:hypothetical protein